MYSKNLESTNWYSNAYCKLKEIDRVAPLITDPQPTSSDTLSDFHQLGPSGFHGRTGPDTKGAKAPQMAFFQKQGGVAPLLSSRPSTD